MLVRYWEWVGPELRIYVRDSEPAEVREKIRVALHNWLHPIMKDIKSTPPFKVIINDGPLPRPIQLCFKFAEQRAHGPGGLLPHLD